MSEIAEADEHLMEFMKTQVRERKADIGSTAPSEHKAGKQLQADVFTMLVKANEDEGAKLKLDDEELVRTVKNYFFRNFTQPTIADWQYLYYAVRWSW